MWLWCWSWRQCLSTWATTYPRQPMSRWLTSGSCSIFSSPLLTSSCKPTLKLWEMKKSETSTIMARLLGWDQQIQMEILKCKLVMSTLYLILAFVPDLQMKGCSKGLWRSTTERLRRQTGTTEELKLVKDSPKFTIPFFVFSLSSFSGF